MSSSFDSFSSTPIIDHFNNYTKTGHHSDTVSNTIPGWLLNMIKNPEFDNEWLMQMIEEALLEKNQPANIWEAIKSEREALREMLREMLMQDMENARATAEALAEEMKMKRKMLEAFRAIVRGENTSAEGQRLLAQFAPMMLFIALLLKDENEEDESQNMEVSSDGENVSDTESDDSAMSGASISEYATGGSGI
jgi:hypothetical protein